MLKVSNLYQLYHNWLALYSKVPCQASPAPDCVVTSTTKSIPLFESANGKDVVEEIVGEIVGDLINKVCCETVAEKPAVDNLAVEMPSAQQQSGENNQLSATEAIEETAMTGQDTKVSENGGTDQKLKIKRSASVADNMEVSAHKRQKSVLFRFFDYDECPYEYYTTVLMKHLSSEELEPWLECLYTFTISTEATKNFSRTLFQLFRTPVHAEDTDKVNFCIALAHRVRLEDVAPETKFYLVKTNPFLLDVINMTIGGERYTDILLMDHAEINELVNAHRPICECFKKHVENVISHLVSKTKVLIGDSSELQMLAVDYLKWVDAPETWINLFNELKFNAEQLRQPPKNDLALTKHAITSTLNDLCALLCVLRAKFSFVGPMFAHYVKTGLWSTECFERHQEVYIVASIEPRSFHHVVSLLRSSLMDKSLCTEPMFASLRAGDHDQLFDNNGCVELFSLDYAAANQRRPSRVRFALSWNEPLALTKSFEYDMEKMIYTDYASLYPTASGDLATRDFWIHKTFFNSNKSDLLVKFDHETLTQSSPCKKCGGIAMGNYIFTQFKYCLKGFGFFEKDETLADINSAYLTLDEHLRKNSICLCESENQRRTFYKQKKFGGNLCEEMVLDECVQTSLWLRAKAVLADLGRIQYQRARLLIKP